MQNIIVDEEFKSLLPMLDKETFELLEENLLQNGCRDSLVLWDDILIDGHNRYAICTKHDIPFNTIQKEFASRDEALIWIISTQVARRNLSSLQLSHFRGLHYRADKRIVSNETGKNQYSEVGGQNDHQPKLDKTSDRLADKYKVSPKTIRRDAKVAEAIDIIGETSPEAKKMILSGEAKISKKDLEELSSKPKEELAEIAAGIEDGTYEKGGPEAPAAAEKNSLPPLDTMIDKIAGEFFTELKKLVVRGDKTETKSALRSFIAMLEDLYSQI